MFETLRQMQIIHQKTFNKVKPFDAHLHFCSPLHSTTHGNNQTPYKVNYCKTLAVVLMFTCLFTVIPYWMFYVLELCKARQIFKDAFLGRFVKMFYNYHYIAVMI